jgi:peptide chain release factor 1
VSLDEKLKQLMARRQELADALAAPDAASSKDFIKTSKEYAALGQIADAITERDRIRQEIEDLAAVMEEAGDDAEMRALAEAESGELKEKLPEIERLIQVLLLPKDEADERNAILEVRAGTGGDEAALFAAGLFRMYQRYAESRKWKFETMNVNETGIGGFKEATAEISGANVFARLKYESGVHRVQRVPVTESSGRIHTSAATVAVLPEAKEVDVKLEESDLRVDVFRASGPGGQSVNTTDSAVRLTHIPSGLVVICQDEKSQHKNKAKAMKVLRARLYEQERAKIAAERADARRSQIGSGDRSERIRTYNFPQGRVTDHRINLTLHKLERIMDGELDELVDTLTSEDQASRLAEAG